MALGLAVALGVSAGAQTGGSPQNDATWLRDTGGGSADPAYAAVDRCERLLANAVGAWQLTPQNVKDCQAGQSRRSPIASINSAAASCWGAIGSVIVELNAAYTEYRLADQLRTSPESKPHFAAANAHASTARGLLPGLRDCVKKVGDERDATARRLAGRVVATPPGNGPGVSGGIDAGASGGTTVPPGSVVLWTRRYVGRWPNGTPNQPPPGIPIQKDWTPTREMQTELLSGRCQLYQGTPDDFIACPGWPNGVRHADLLSDTAFVCRNPSPPPFCLAQATPVPPTRPDPEVLPVVNDGRNFSMGLSDGAQECVAQAVAAGSALAGTVFPAVATAVQTGKWDQVDRLLGMHGEGWGPVLKRWVDDLAFEGLHTLQEPQDLPRGIGAREASQRDYQRGRLAGLRLCGYGVSASAGRLAGHAVGEVGGPLVARIADAARKTASRRVTLAITAAENVLRDVSAQPGRTMTAAQQASFTKAVADIGLADEQVLSGRTLRTALEAERAITDGIIRQLEGDTLYLPVPVGQPARPVTLGAPIGRGLYGWVFPVTENGRLTGSAVKVVGNYRSYRANGHALPPGTPALVDNIGGDSVLSQVKGSVVLQRLGIPTPTISYFHAAQNAGEFSVALMERIDTSLPSVDTWAGTRFAQAAKRTAVIDLHNRLAGAGYIAADLAPRNVYFVMQNGVVRAGVWDADLIIRLPITADAGTRARFSGILGGAAAGNNPMGLNYDDLFYGIDYLDARQAMSIIQKIQWGF
jgi:hypothetical protein